MLENYGIIIAYQKKEIKMEAILNNGFSKVLDKIKEAKMNASWSDVELNRNIIAKLREKHGDNTPEFKRALHDKRVAEADEVLEALDGVALAKRMLLMFINLDSRFVADFAYNGHLLVANVSDYGVELMAYNKNGGFKSLYFNACELENDFEKAGSMIERVLSKIDIK